MNEFAKRFQVFVRTIDLANSVSVNLAVIIAFLLLFVPGRFGCFFPELIFLAFSFSSIAFLGIKSYFDNILDKVPDHLEDKDFQYIVYQETDLRPEEVIDDFKYGSLLSKFYLIACTIPFVIFRSNETYVFLIADALILLVRVIINNYRYVIKGIGIREPYKPTYQVNDFKGDK